MVAEDLKTGVEFVMKLVAVGEALRHRHTMLDTMVIG